MPSGGAVACVIRNSMATVVRAFSTVRAINFFYGLVAGACAGDDAVRRRGGRQLDPAAAVLRQHEHAGPAARAAGLDRQVRQTPS